VLVKYLPSWIPFNKIHETGHLGRERIERLITRPFEHVLEERAKGTAQPSFVSDCLAKLQSNGSEESKENLDVIRWAAGALYGGMSSSMDLFLASV
jgi:hypothetical protein